MSMYTTLLWSDEFEGSGERSPSQTHWSHAEGRGSQDDGWGNAEIQTYTKSLGNAYVSDGTLKIRALRDGRGHWTSARLHTKGKHDWLYGRLEVRAKLPMENGTWPAIWMLPSGQTYGGRYWPDNGEIDLMEHCQLFGMGSPFGTIHRKAGFGSRGWPAGRKELGETARDFHVYGLEWGPDEIAWLYDGKPLSRPYRRADGNDWMWWPFDRPFHLIINLAMGGNLGGTVDEDIDEAVMEIDWVRVYQ